MRIAQRSCSILRPNLRGLVRQLLKDTSGADTVEFALAAIPFMMFLLGVIEFSRLYWTHSELQYAAEATARCATVNCCASSPATCGNSTGTSGLQKFAANQLLGMSVPSSKLSNFSLTSQACGNQVSFNYTFNFLVGPIIPNASLTLNGTACGQG